MGVAASFRLPLGDVVTNVAAFVNVFIILYSVVLIAYLLTSWVRLPYSPALDRIQRFLHDVCEPYLRLFRRFVPMVGGLDLSPILAFVALTVINRLVILILDQLQ